MSNPNQFFQDLSFGPEAVTAVNKPYDLVCQTLQNIGQPEVDREIIAARILQAAESRPGRQQTMPARHPWIDRARLSAAPRLMQGQAIACGIFPCPAFQPVIPAHTRRDDLLRACARPRPHQRTARSTGCMRPDRQANPASFSRPASQPDRGWSGRPPT
jgi:hypothetical protein